MKIRWKILIFFLIIVFSIAFIGGLFTSSNTKTDWYESIKPSITPPDYVFPIVWNILFFMIALSLYLAWTNSKNKKIKKKVAVIFGINLLLNLFWSVLFFGLRSPEFAFYELILLWASIFVMISINYKINKTSAYLLIPYLFWVSFAGILNYLIAF
ncbi:MAG: TspO/MBR family protein [archaeon]